MIIHEKGRGKICIFLEACCVCSLGERRSESFFSVGRCVVSDTHDQSLDVLYSACLNVHGEPRLKAP